MITGIDHPTGGQVVVNGTTLFDHRKPALLVARQESRHVFQFFNCSPLLTLLETSCCPWIMWTCMTSKERPAYAMELLEMVGLKEQANKLPAGVFDRAASK